ncbi:hypothetical protein SUGI_0033780 [Cryptomeria japonica]|nr:hypothetical protein SUGI_0033780 [Cryptomeria japonica]
MDGSLTTDSSSLMGTLGYIAPERGQSTRMTEKIDVYNYGVMLLELIMRKKVRDSSFAERMEIVRWVKSYSGREDAMIDVELGDEVTEAAIKGDMVGMVRIGLKCIEDKAEDRPSMREVVEMLRAIRPLEALFKFRVEICQV